jgi:hypothetical protein
MNERKLNQLFGAARKEPAPAPPEGFDQTIMRSVRRDPPSATRPALSLFDQLNLLFPRLALASAAIVLLCVAGELAMSATTPSLTDDVAQLSDQWLLTADEF